MTKIMILQHWFAASSFFSENKKIFIDETQGGWHVLEYFLFMRLTRLSKHILQFLWNLRKHIQISAILYCRWRRVKSKPVQSCRRYCHIHTKYSRAICVRLFPLRKSIGTVGEKCSDFTTFGEILQTPFIAAPINSLFSLNVCLSHSRATFAAEFSIKSLK